MPARLVALDEGPDIPLDRDMIVVGRHPQCDARLDSIRVSRRHCCMMLQPDGAVIVKDLGSTNGIRINGQRVEKGRLRPQDELSIAHIRYKLDDGQAQEMTLAESLSGLRLGHSNGSALRMKSGLEPVAEESPHPIAAAVRDPLAAAVRDLLPSGVADKCRIQVIVQMQPEDAGPRPGAEAAEACPPDSRH